MVTCELTVVQSRMCFDTIRDSPAMLPSIKSSLIYWRCGVCIWTSNSVSPSCWRQSSLSDLNCLSTPDSHRFLHNFLCSHKAAGHHKLQLDHVDPARRGKVATSCKTSLVVLEPWRRFFPRAQSRRLSSLLRLLALVSLPTCP